MRMIRKFFRLMQNSLKYIKPSAIIFIASFMIFSLPACQNKLSENRARKGSENWNNGLFIVRLVAVREGSEKTLPEQLFESEKEIKDIHFNETTFFTVIRSEVMVPTLNSYYPMMTLNNYERVEEIDFLVEFIDVNNTPEDLELYRSLMSSYFGPANGILIEKNLVFSFTAFETKKVISITDDESSWNQIHISGDYPEYLDLNWDSLYTDLFRNEFSVDLDSIWDLLPDIRELPPYYSGQFIKELHVH